MWSDCQNYGVNGMVFFLGRRWWRCQMGQCLDGLVCFEEKNEVAIYRGMKGKKKTMEEIKKEKEGKWNLSGRYKKRKRNGKWNGEVEINYLIK